MPELPEVQTTVNGLNTYVKGLTIKDVWTDFSSTDKRFLESIKNAEYFKNFRKKIIGAKIVRAERRAKNVLILLSNNYTILIHMKMTGHLLYGTYERNLITNNQKQITKVKNSQTKMQSWEPLEPESLKDTFNRFIHLVFIFTNGKHLALCDSRKFSKTVLLETETSHTTSHLKNIGPEPLEADFTWNKLKGRLHVRKNWKIKTALMSPELVAGIGNIYSDEALWLSCIHPERKVENISDTEMKLLFKSIQKVLSSGIDFGGDSMSDYRNILGEKGNFQNKHNVYKKKGVKCGKRNCKGTIVRKIVGGRSAHFCDTHQK